MLKLFILVLGSTMGGEVPLIWTFVVRVAISSACC